MDTEMKEMFGLMFDKFDELQREIAGVKSEIAGVKSEVAGVKSEVAGVKSEVAGVKSEVAGVKSEVADVKNEVVKIQLKIEHHIEPKLDALYEGYQMNLESQAEIRRRQKEVEKNIAFWKE